MKAILLLLLLCLSLPAVARIGETVDECKKRYGEPKREVPNKLTFFKQGLHITVAFIDGKAVMIAYTGEKVISKVIIDELLKVNADRLNWKEVEDSKDPWGGKVKDLRSWKTSPDSLVAYYHPSMAELYIATDGFHAIYLKAQQDHENQQNEKEKKKIEGL